MLPLPHTLLTLPTMRMKINVIPGLSLSFTHSRGSEVIPLVNLRRQSRACRSQQPPYSTLEARMPADGKCCLAKLNNKVLALFREG